MQTNEELLELSPYLSNLKRKGKLAPSRLVELYSAARSNSKPLAPTDCCGSSCKPCVLELWKQECRVWEECHADGEVEEEGLEEKKEGVEIEKGKD